MLLVKYILNILAQLLQVVRDISLHLDSREFKQVIYLCWEAASRFRFELHSLCIKKQTNTGPSAHWC